MAEKLCGLRKKGGGGNMSETVLWTNSAPTSTFLSENITISDISGFKYLKVVYRNSTGVSREVSAIFEVADLQKATQNVPVLWYIGDISPTGETEWIRRIDVKNNTTINISHASAFRYVATDDTYTIPMQIIGLK